MSDNSKIEWTDATWNPLRAKNPETGKLGHHCVKISPACTHCYAASMNKRLGTNLDYSSSARVETYIDEKALTAPLHWRRPRRIFVCSMTDLFLDAYTDEQIDRVFAVMYGAQWHTFQVLTKRPERMHAYLADKGARINGIGCAAYAIAIQRKAEQAEVLTNGDIVDDVNDLWPLPNVQLGVTAEDQQRANERIPLLLNTPAAMRFVSCEPLLGPIRLDLLDNGKNGWIDCLGGVWGRGLSTDHQGDGAEHIPEGTTGDCIVGWVIAGGESGRGARPMHPDWARGLRDQCGASVPFFFKQWGEWGPQPKCTDCTCVPGELCCSRRGTVMEDRHIIERVGKKAAGRLLDGRTWDEFPAAAEAAVE